MLEPHIPKIQIGTATNYLVFSLALLLFMVSPVMRGTRLLHRKFMTNQAAELRRQPGFETFSLDSSSMISDRVSTLVS